MGKDRIEDRGKAIMPTGIPDPGICEVEDCNEKRRARKRCKRHYKQLLYAERRDIMREKMRAYYRRTHEMTDRNPVMTIDYDDYWAWVKKELGL